MVRLLWFLFVILFLAACSARETSSPLQSATTTRLPAATFPPTWTPPPPTATPLPSATAEVLPFLQRSLEPFSLLDAEDIASFRAQITMEGTGADSGQQSHRTIEAIFVEDPYTFQVVMSEAAPGQEPTRQEFRRVGDQGYRHLGDGWEEVPLEELAAVEGLSRFHPRLMMRALSEAERVGRESVHGRETLHVRGGRAMFTGSSSGIGVEQADTVVGDMWVDVDLGFPVRVVATLTGSQLMGLDEPATVMLTMEALDFNQPFVIEAPQTAP
jgi:hypothetical protein